jgi:quercetin dioxygenase-like cupin family protein
MFFDAAEFEGMNEGSLVKSSRRVATAALALSAVVVSSATAHAAPPAGVSAVVLSKQTVKDKDYIVTEITIAPNASTGWHTHRGEVYGVIRAGTLTHYGADCRQDGVYPAGAAITDPTGPDHVHIGRNEGTTPLVLDVTYVDPAGAPTSDSAPTPPGCDVS